MIYSQMTPSTMFIQGEVSEVKYKGRMNRSPQISEVWKAISDDKALTLFNTVALSSGKTDMLLSTMNLTRKQYYSKMEGLSRQGLLVRKGGRYYLTTLGKVLYELQSTLGVALDNYWKLKAIDSLLTPPGLPEFELNKMIDTLLENDELKKLILTKLK
jgi:predicted transcriptional regulator